MRNFVAAKSATEEAGVSAQVGPLGGVCGHREAFGRTAFVPRPETPMAAGSATLPSGDHRLHRLLRGPGVHYDAKRPDAGREGPAPGSASMLCRPGRPARWATRRPGLGRWFSPPGPHRGRGVDGAIWRRPAGNGTTAICSSGKWQRCLREGGRILPSSTMGWLAERRGKFTAAPRNCALASR